MENASNMSTSIAALAVAVSIAGLAFAGAAHAAPAPYAAGEGMHGDPAAAAPFWRYQQQDYDCGELAVADVVGEITGHQPTENEVTAAAGKVPSVNHPGPIYSPANRTSNSDLQPLLAHYGIAASSVHTNTGSLIGDLDQGRKIIVGVNDKIIWNKPGDRTVENHFVVVTGIDTRAGMVHLNDTGSSKGRDEQVTIANFEQAWATSNNFAVVTK